MEENNNSGSFETINNSFQSKEITLNTTSNLLKIKTDKNSYISKFNNGLKKDKSSKKGFLQILIPLLIIASIFVGIFFMKNMSPKKLSNSNYEIKDEYYINSINKIYSNLDSFIGKTISIDGMLKTYQTDNKKYMMVYRKTPGSSGNNGIAGFDFEYVDMPEIEENTWINVTGILTLEKENEKEFLKIDATSVVELTNTETKEEFVTK